jgi:hypothetical protein
MASGRKGNPGRGMAWESLLDDIGNSEAPTAQWRWHFVPPGSMSVTGLVKAGYRDAQKMCLDPARARIDHSCIQSKTETT